MMDWGCRRSMRMAPVVPLTEARIAEEQRIRERQNEDHRALGLQERDHEIDEGLKL